MHFNALVLPTLGPSWYVPAGQAPVHCVPGVPRNLPASHETQTAVAPELSISHPATQASAVQRLFVAFHVDPTPQSEGSTAQTVAASSPAAVQQHRRAALLDDAPHVEVDPGLE